MTTHPNLMSSARWIARRVAVADNDGDMATARYEREWFQRLLSLCDTSERDDLDAEFFHHYRHYRGWSRSPGVW